MVKMLYYSSMINIFAGLFVSITLILALDLYLSRFFDIYLFEYKIITKLSKIVFAFSLLIVISGFLSNII